jgi:hypothetical protein
MSAIQMQTPIAPALLAEVLSPYKPHCRYLLRAWTESDDGETPWSAADGWSGPAPVARYRGEFGITESCYIDETGHFNAVEFNICFNQFYYVTVAQAVVASAFPALRGMSFEEYRRRQLPDVLIHDFRSAFKKPLRRESFHGQIAYTAVEDMRRFVLFRTRCRFWDDLGGSCHGEVTLVLMNRTRAGLEAGAG